MTSLPPDPTPQDRPFEACAHAWLLVTCGECGASVDELRKDRADAASAQVVDTQASSTGSATKLFIVARGHPELVEQLKAVMGDSESIRVIEDRRQTSRDPASPAGHEVSVIRAEFRRRALESESVDTS